MRIIGIFLVFLSIWGCSKSNESKTSAGSEVLRQLENQIVVVDEMGNLVSEATIIIGNNVNQTNDAGMIEVPSDWTTPQAVTAMKEGYSNVTYLNTQPGAFTLTLKRQAVAPRLELNGQVTGFENLKKDGIVDFALVAPALTPATSLNFDMSSIVSSEVDTISVMGVKMQIPTNVFLPKQTENYGIFSVTLNKAFYKLFFLDAGEKNIGAIRGKFNFKKLADHMQSGKSFFEAVNEIQFTSAESHIVNVQNAVQTLNISPNKHTLVPTINFTLKNPTTDKMLFGVSLFEENGKLIPADVKYRDNNLTQTLTYPSTGTNPKILLALAGKEVVNNQTLLSKSMATALTTPEALDQAVFIEEIPKPTGDLTSVKMQVPVEKANIKPFATYASLSDVELIPTSSYTLEKKTILWEVYSPDWIDHADIPAQLPMLDAKVKRWDVVYYGVQSSEKKVFTGLQSLENATHAVQNAFDF